MAARESKRELRNQARRNAIVRTSRIWTKLYKELTSELKDISHKWLKGLLRQAEQEISSGTLTNTKELPERFTKQLTQTLRQALAQGYLLNHVYVQEIKKAREGKKYHGRIMLSDADDDARLIASLEKFIAADVSEEWHEVIPEEAVNWLKDYVPKLAGVLSEDVLEKTREVIRSSMMTGTTLHERMKALRESSDVLQRMTDARIESIARTEITRADSMGRLISMKSNEDVIGIEFSAIMDDRTTEICSSRHGLVMRLDDPRLPENTPPLHVRCRSLLISLTVYDYPDGLLTSHEFDEVPSGIQRETDIEEVRSLLGGFENAVEKVIEDNPSVTDPRARAEEIIRQNEEYRQQHDELQAQIGEAVARGDVSEYNRLATLQHDILRQWQSIEEELREAKIEMAERGVIYASGISKRLQPNDVTEIVHLVEEAPASIRRVWNLLEDRMKIADVNTRNAYYSSSEGAVHFDLYKDRYPDMSRPKYGVLFHELGHLIDDKAIGFGRYVSGTDELRRSLASEVDSYITSTLMRLKREAIASGKSPKEIKKADAYASVEKELSGQLSFSSKIAVSDVFSGVTKNKIEDGWKHSTSYWKQNETNVCLEFFAQTFADSINNPEGIEITKKYFPESYKIFERMIHEIGEKK